MSGLLTLPEKDLGLFVEAHAASPLAFVEASFPWAQEGTMLAAHEGPDTWQVRLLHQVGEALSDPDESARFAVASGHGVGKTALAVWLIIWFISTRPHPQIVVTANTSTQLATKTWRELSKWLQMSIFRDTFTWTATRCYHKQAQSTWFAAAVPWRADRPEAFAGTHEEHVLLLMDEACHDDQTEVLTDAGWKLFADLTGSEKLLTMDPHTEEALYQAPAKLFRAYREGPMLLYNRRGANFCVTPNHRLWHQSWYGRAASGNIPSHWMPWRFTEAQHMSSSNSRIARWVNWHVTEHAAWTLPAYQGTRKHWPVRELPMDAWMPWLGWYFSEGSLGSYIAGEPYAVGISNQDPQVLEEIMALTRALGFVPHLYEQTNAYSVVVSSRHLAAWLAQWGRYAHMKYLPPVVRHASARQIRLFLDAYARGDGYAKSSGRRIIYTSSARMAGDLQECILKVGGIAVVRPRKLAGLPAVFASHTSASRHDGFVVSWQDSRSAILFRKQHVEEIAYKGYVYCAEVPPHHLLLTRRNGYVMWSGNSAIDDLIWETSEGMMTTPGSLWVAFGNPTRATGRFRECFPGGRFAHRWHHMRVDSRQAKMADQKQIDAWVTDYGMDSDFIRVRVLGEFPRQAVGQFISEADLEAAELRGPTVDPMQPTTIGVDVARYGDDRSVIVVREGSQIVDVRVYREIDTVRLAGFVCEVAETYRGTPQQPEGYGQVNYSSNEPILCIDGVGLGAGVVDMCKTRGYRVEDILSGGKPQDPTRYENIRAESWAKMRDWIRTRAALDKRSPYYQELRADLLAPEYAYDDRGRLQMERKQHMKDRGAVSPDVADALSFTFSVQVAPRRVPPPFSGGGIPALQGLPPGLSWMAA